MATIDKFRKLALALPEVQELPHFEKTSFRYNKKIFATLDEQKQLATLKLSTVDQSVYAQVNPSKIYQVPNKWGLQGWTTFEIKHVTVPILRDALQIAYAGVSAPSR